MNRFRRYRPTPSMLVALLALVLATTGSAVAATLITSKQIKDGSIQTKDISKKARTQLKGKLGPAGPQGPQGVQGPKGDKGDKGDTGTVDTSNFYTKGASDGRYLRSTVTVVKNITASISADSYAWANVDCPSGYQAIAGGVDVNQIYTGKVSSSNPTFGGNRTYTQSEGQHGPATGWFGAVTTQGTGSPAADPKVVVICAPIG